MNDMVLLKDLNKSSHSYGVSIVISDHTSDTSEHTRLDPSQTGRYTIYLPRGDRRLS